MWATSARGLVVWVPMVACAGAAFFLSLLFPKNQDPLWPALDPPLPPPAATIVAAASAAGIVKQALSPLPPPTMRTP